MGWNEGYRIFEAGVIGAYDLGKLDRALLSVLMSPYRGTDIDSGGREGLKSYDGKEVEEIVIETFGLEMPSAPADGSPVLAWDNYFEAVDELFMGIARRFGWE